MQGTFGDMPPHQFSELVKTHFRYLLDDHGFSVVSTEVAGNDFCTVTLGSVTWYMRVFREMGQVTIMVGPSAAPGTWFYLSDVVTFLDRQLSNTQWSSFGASSNTSTDYASWVRNQLKAYADKMRPYIDQISQLFRQESFQRRQGDLEEWAKHMEKIQWEAVARK